MNMSCPNCNSNKFIIDPSVSVNISDTLDRWEMESKTVFSKTTRQEYSNCPDVKLYTCAACYYGAFVPPCSGTSSFYNDITIDDNYYIDEKWEFKKTYNIIEKYCPQTILDYGCGGGAFLKKIKQKFSFIDISGFDENPQSSRALNQENINFINDINNLPKNSFDMITGFQIFEHLENPFLNLQKLKNSLKDNGVIVISVPNSRGPIRFFPNALTEIPPHHVNKFNEKSLKIFLNNAGFTVEEVSFEPLSKILWTSYLPMIIDNILPPFLKKVFVKFKIRSLLIKFLEVLAKTKIDSLPIKGHSIYVVGRKCAE